MLEEREQVYSYMKQQLKLFSEEVGGRVLDTPTNPISLGLSLEFLGSGHLIEGEDRLHENATFFGSMLWTRYLQHLFPCFLY